jgi:hypothetical protein|tara:strand:- start:10414 stop:11214 length:801 start_codon:yes stop_codon:yes gene_type:complete
MALFGIFGKNNVKKEAVEALRFLKAEEVVSEEEKRKLKELLKKIKNGKKFLMHNFKNIEKFRESCIDNFMYPDLQNHIQKRIDDIKSSESVLGEVISKVKKLIDISIEVVNIITDMELKEEKKLKSLHNKEKKLVLKGIELEKNAIENMRTKLISLNILDDFLSGIKALITKIYIDLREALISYLRASSAFNASYGENAMKTHLKRMEDSLRLALDKFIRAEKLLEKSIEYISKFKKYLSDIEGDIKKVKEYEKWIKGSINIKNNH